LIYTEGIWHDPHIKELYQNLVMSLIDDVKVGEIVLNIHSSSLSVKSHSLHEAATNKSLILNDN